MMNEENVVHTDEHVVLSKFEHPDGEETTDPKFEFERLIVHNGTVVEHSQIENGEVVGPVEGSDLLGKDIGTLLS